MKTLKYIITFLVFPCILNAQQDEFMFSHAKEKDGLSYGITNSLLRDRNHFLWIGTYDGLNRYDGTSFQVYKSNLSDSTTLLNNTVHDVCEDKNGNIWCATGSGISCYVPGKNIFHNYLLYDDSSNVIDAYGASTIHCDRQGRIWCCSFGGLYEFIPSERRFKNYRHYDSDKNSVSSTMMHKNGIAEDPVQNGLWLATEKGINYFDTDKKIAYHYLNNPDHLPIFNENNTYPVTTHNKKLYYSDNTTLQYCIYDFNTRKLEKISLGQFSRKKQDAPLATIYIDSKDNAWITSWNYTLYFIDGKTKKINEFYHDDLNPKSINSNFFWDVYEDDDGTIWFGGVDGLSWYNSEKSAYRIFKPAEKYPEIKQFNNIVTFFQSDDGTIWFSADGCGLFSFDPDNRLYENFHLPEYISKKDSSGTYNSVMSIVQRGDELWLGTRHGLHVFNMKTKKFSPFPGIENSNGLGEHTIRQLNFDKKGNMWFLANDEGFYSYNIATKTFRHFRDFGNSLLKPVNVYRLFRDSKDQMWIGSLVDNYFCKFDDKTETIKVYDVSDSNMLKVKKTGGMTYICEDGNGIFWITAPGNGLVRFDPFTEKAKIYRESDGLGFDHSGAVISDDYGKIWVAGYQNVSVFDPVTKQFDNFDLEYGESDYQYRNKLYKLKNGNILSGILDAIIELNPSKHNKKIAVPPVIISNFSIFEKPILRERYINDLHLSYKENFFSIDYSILTGVDRDKFQFYYILEGFDKEWVKAGKRSTATYTNVPGGNYTFKVKAVSDAGDESKPSQIKISISKIFYQTWWFRLLIALSIFLIIRLYMRYREHQREQEEAEQAIAYFANSEYTNSNAEEILWDLARNCISRLGFEDCVIYLLDEKENVFVQKAASGDKTTDQHTVANPLAIPFGKGIVGSVAASGKTEIIGDTSKDKRYIVDDAMRSSEITIPIIHEGKVIGIIDSEHRKKNFFTGEHQRILETIASICATKIVNAQAAQELVEKEKKILEIDKKVAETRLMALRAQMNPHFIFNCLNAIDNYILRNDADHASRYLNKFARLVRTILSQSDKSFISLQTELDLLNNYVELENLRLTEKFDYILSIDDSVDTEEIEIPTMVLQPFVENAIVHGLSHKQGKKSLSLTISTFENTLHCIIEDTGVGREEALRIKNSKIQTHESKGMRVTEGRLELLQQQVKEKGMVIITDLYDTKGEASGTRVEINIPFESAF